MWNLATGNAVIGFADNGVAIGHQGLRQFSTSGQYIGGNFIYGWDVGRWTSSTPTIDGNVDEQEPEYIAVDDKCNSDPPVSTIVSAHAGHGTHVAGIAAVNSDAGIGLKGTCKHCGIIMYRVAKFCFQNNLWVPINTYDAWEIANTLMADNGAQVVNMSYGDNWRDPSYCTSNPLDAYCASLDLLDSKGIVIVAASGNIGGTALIQFPANLNRVVAAGGTTSTGALWDDLPNNCLAYQFCGSNYTNQPWDPKQEVVAAARSVTSIMYPYRYWNVQTECNESLGSPYGDGIGLCTGTSMSTPHISGVFGVLRSINPLVLPGDPDPLIEGEWGVRTVLAQTTDRAQASLPWINTVGYGIPDGAAAARKMLGKSKSITIKNRVTPLFGMYSAARHDFAETTSPQFANALIGRGYDTTGAYVPGYGAFPTTVRSDPIPKADVHVLTTEYSPLPNHPVLVPLYQIVRERARPSGCLSTNQNCVPADHTLVTTTAEVELAHAAGYQLGNIQGYIYAPCPPGSKEGCIPKNTRPFYRACKVSDDDCATFLEDQRLAFEAAGYLTAFPAGSSKLMGYAYPPKDDDGDRIINGFEAILGTNPYLADSDGDGALDDEEFPPAGVSLNDPCINSVDLLDHCS